MTTQNDDEREAQIRRADAFLDNWFGGRAAVPSVHNFAALLVAFAKINARVEIAWLPERKKAFEQNAEQHREIARLRTQLRQAREVVFDRFEAERLGGAPPSADAMEIAAIAYGFIGGMPDPVTLAPRQIEIIEGCARAIKAARGPILDDAQQFVVWLKRPYATTDDEIALAISNMVMAARADERAKAMEEAAQRCDVRYKRYNNPVAGALAAEIRALATPPAEEPK
jgi:hypothetical protein